MAGRRRALQEALVTALLVATAAAAADGGMSSWEASSDEDYHILVENRMGATMHLSCYAMRGGGQSEFYHSFRADQGREVQLPFLKPASRARVVCKWACDGNYMRGVPIFSSAWREASSGACRRRGGGCAVVFEGREMFVVERAHGGRGRLLGDLPEQECQKMLLVFNRRCWYKQHRHSYVGRPMYGLADYMMA